MTPTRGASYCRTISNQRIVAKSFELMERETGLEPVTSSLGSWHSTTELLPQSVIIFRAYWRSEDDHFRRQMGTKTILAA